MILFSSNFWRCLVSLLTGFVQNTSEYSCIVLMQPPTKQQLYVHFPSIRCNNQITQTIRSRYNWIRKDKLLSDVILWTPAHGPACAGRQTRTYLYRLCVDTGCSLRELPWAMEREREWESQGNPCCQRELMMMMMMIIGNADVTGLLWSPHSVNMGCAGNFKSSHYLTEIIKNRKLYFDINKKNGVMVIITLILCEASEKTPASPNFLF